MLNFSADMPEGDTMTDPHQLAHHAGSGLAALIGSCFLSLATVGAWIVEKLPATAAAITIAFTLWQWHRMAKRDRLEREEKERMKNGAHSSDAAC